MVATYALINKVLLKFHTDLLRFLFLFHGLFIIFLLLLFFFFPYLLLQCCMEMSSPGQQDCQAWGKCPSNSAWKTSSNNIRKL